MHAITGKPCRFEISSSVLCSFGILFYLAIKFSQKIKEAFLLCWEARGLFRSFSDISRGKEMKRQRTTHNRSSVSQEEFYKFKFSKVQWTNTISYCPAYHPTMEEFDDPFVYLQKIAPEASKFGICKIISPLKASASAADVLKNEIEDFEFKTYIQPLRLPKWNTNDKGVFSEGKRKYTYDTFESKATEEFKCQCPRLGDLPPSYMEKKFWLEMTHGGEGTVEYGVNVEGSAFSSDPNDQLGKCKWHLKTLKGLPQSIFRLLQHSIPGITDPMLYIGMLFSMFAWHVEDHYLHSINYHHSGAPKTWYGVPGHHAPQFEKVARDHVYTRDILSTVNGAFEEIANKTTMFPPQILLKNGVSVYKTVQNPGEFVITFPKAYHSGFSNGFNCGEAVNFAIRDWFPFGEEAGNRYARLCKMVILPYQELLFRELSGHEAAELPTSVKDPVVHHISSLNKALCCLNNLRMPFNHLPNSQETIICHLCKRDCYLAFIECNSCFQQTCLFHEFMSRHCSCGHTRVVLLRESIQQLEEVSKNFEGEKIISRHVNIISCIEEGLARDC